MRDKNTPITQIMTRNPITISPDQSLTDVKIIFEENSFRHIPVCVEGRPVGMVSRTDFMLVMMGVPSPGESNGNATFNSLMFEALDVNHIMTENIIMIEPNATIGRVGKIFSKNRFHALPVVENDKLLGIVTTIDIVRFFTED